MTQINFLLRAALKMNTFVADIKYLSGYHKFSFNNLVEYDELV